MATEGIRITVADDTIAATLDRIDRLASQPGEIMSAIAGYLVQTTQRHFEREQGPDGKWQRLSPRTAAQRIGRRRRGSDNILRVSNRLYSSIIGDSSATEAQVGTNIIYAAIQQFGGDVKIPAREQTIHLGRTNRGRRFTKASNKRAEARQVKIGAHTVTIPARPYLYLTAEDATEIERIAADAFREEASR